jgi:2-polyprenyl-3-methyl-5-hydroxy-6-metoxy-1,4-benzoquinol methylase
MTISENYKKLLELTHNLDRNWGQTAGTRTGLVLRYASLLNENTILDYGSGSGSLKSALDKLHPKVYNVIEYEPGNPEKAAPPQPCGYVVCIDVLEHVEPEYVDQVLDDLQRVTLHGALLTISTEPAFKILPDGRNAHLTIQPFEWWNTKLQQRFVISFESHNTRACTFFVTPK